MSLIDNRESFPSLEDGSGNGVALSESQAGDAAAGKVGSTAFAFKDSSGNLVLPQLDSQGRMPVSTEIQGTRVRANGSATGATGANSAVFQPVAAIAAVANKKYLDMVGSVSSRRGALFQLIYKDTINTVVLAEAICDSGHYTTQIGMMGDEFDVPSSGSSPQFIIQGNNYENASGLHASMCMSYV